MNSLPVEPETGFHGPFPAPAKLNLFLHITGRRPDGYHELQSLVQFVDVGDRLWFRRRDDHEFVLSGDLPGLGVGENLVVRAASLLRESAEIPGFDIRLEKNLPVGGGLGGGSSDAATTLLVLDSLLGLGLGVERLAALGLMLGADVPVFVRGQASWVEGIGEQLAPVKLDEAYFLVVTPPVSISTAEVFSDSALTRDSRAITISDFLANRGRNDCERVVRRQFPEVAEVMNWLAQFARPRLTGTGASVFAPFDTRAAALEVLDLLPDNWRGFVGQGCNRSPLVSMLATCSGQSRDL